MRGLLTHRRLSDVKPGHPPGRTIKVKLLTPTCPQGVEIKLRAFASNKSMDEAGFMNIMFVKTRSPHERSSDTQ